MVHSVPGRARLRLPEDVVADGGAWAKRTAAASGVTSVRWTPQSRSLVITFDSGLGLQDVLDHIPDTAPERPLPRTKRVADAPTVPLWRQLMLPVISLGAGLFGLGTLSTLTIAAGGLPIARRAGRALLRGRLTIDVLDATAVSLLLSTGDPLAAGVSVALIESGERLRRNASGRARTVIRTWMGGDQRGVRLQRDGTEPRVAADTVAIGDRAVVYAGETVPIDGTVITGTGSVDNRTWTGEAVPVPVHAGDAVLAGATVVDGRLVIEITAAGDETRAGRLAAAIEEALAANTPTSDRARRIADRFVAPVLAGSALAYLFTGDIRRVISMLIVDFGTGIRISVPTSYLTTMVAAARAQVLFKNGAAIEKMAAVDTIVFDKTGTLTTGRLDVVGVDAANGHDVAAVLRYAAAAEGHLPHPIARAIRRYARTQRLALPQPARVTVAPGGGVEAEIEGHVVHVGTRSYLESAGIALPAAADTETSVARVAVDHAYAGTVRMHDGLRSEADEVVAALRRAGITSLWLATGDRQRVADRVARALRLDGVRARLMPEDKAALVAELRAEGRRVAVVGDGINDAAAMAEASVGIAVARGADMARESADVVLGTENLALLVDAVYLSRFTMRLVRQDIALVALPNGVALAAATAGVLGPLAATVVNNGSTLVAAGNSLRPLLYRSSL